MHRQFVLATSLSLMLGVGISHADEHPDAQSQVDFGIDVARLGLWKEAIFRWQRAVALDPTHAAAWNNLAIGFEQEGRFEEAHDAYETALDLEPNNLSIEQNYDFFLEVNERVSQSTR